MGAAVFLDFVVCLMFLKVSKHVCLPCPSPNSNCAMHISGAKSCKQKLVWWIRCPTHEKTDTTMKHCRCSDDCCGGASWPRITIGSGHMWGDKFKAEDCPASASILTRKILEGPARRDVLTDEELDALGFAEGPEEPRVPAVALAPADVPALVNSELDDSGHSEIE